MKASSLSTRADLGKGFSLPALLSSEVHFVS